MFSKFTKKSIVTCLGVAIILGAMFGVLRATGLFEGLSNITFSAITGAIIGALSVFIVKPKH